MSWLYFLCAGGLTIVLVMGFIMETFAVDEPENKK